MLRVCVIIASILAASSIAFAQTAVPTTTPAWTFELGFDGVHRAGRWTPMRVEALETDQPPARLDLEGRSIELISAGGLGSLQRVTFQQPISPGAIYQFVLPIGHRLDAPLRWNASSDDRSATLFGGIDPSTLRTVGPVGGIAVGVSGHGPALQGVVASMGPLRESGVEAGALRPQLLPDRSIAYGSVDLLVLAEVDLARIDARVQSAILDYLRAGGVVLAWPGTASVFDGTGPLADAMPATLGPIVSVDRPGRSPIAFRSLIARDGAARTSIVGPSNVAIDLVTRRVGLGTLALLGGDPSSLDSTADGARWRAILQSVGLGADVLNPRGQSDRADALERLLDQELDRQLALIPDSSSSWITTLILALIALGLIAGPGDSALSWLLGATYRWRWHSLAGWGVLVVGVGMLPLIPAAGRSPRAFVQVIDEADGSQVFETRWERRRSPIELHEADAPMWWHATSLRYPGQRRAESFLIDLAINDEGSVPSSSLPASIVTLEGRRSLNEPALIDVETDPQGNRLVRNRSDRTTSIAVRLEDGSIRGVDRLGAGEAISITSLAPGDEASLALAVVASPAGLRSHVPAGTREMVVVMELDRVHGAAEPLVLVRSTWR